MNLKRWLALATALLMLSGIMPTALAATTPGTIPYIPPNPVHNHTWRVIENTATCTSGGLVTYYCPGCDDSYEENVPPLGHDYSIVRVIKDPTCTESGIRRITCSRDSSHYYDESFPALGHTWGDWEVYTPSTCIEYGRDIHTCRRCGATEYRKALSLGDHQWGEWYVVRQPSPAQPGLEERKCQICGLTEQREIPYDPTNPPFAADPAITLTVVEQNAYQDVYYVDDQILYYFTITNTGDKPFYGEGTWKYLGGYQELPWQLGNGALQPGESTSGYTSYTFTLQDALQGWQTVGFGASANISAAGEPDYIYANPVEFNYRLTPEPHASLNLNGGMEFHEFAEGETVPIDLQVNVGGNSDVRDITVEAEIYIAGPSEQSRFVQATALSFPGLTPAQGIQKDTFHYLIDLLGIVLQDGQEALVTLHFVARAREISTGSEIESNPWDTEFNVKKAGGTLTGEPRLELTVTQTSPLPARSGDYENTYSLAEINQTFYYLASITNTGSAPCYVTSLDSWINGGDQQNMFPYAKTLLMPGATIDNIPIMRPLSASYLTPANIAPEIAEKLEGQLMIVFSASYNKAIPDGQGGYQDSGEWAGYSNNDSCLYFVGKENPGGNYALQLTMEQTSPAWKDSYPAAEMENTFYYSATVTNIGSEPVYLFGFTLLTNGGNDGVFSHDNMPWVILPGDSISTTVWREIGTGSILPGTETETLLGATVAGFEALGSKAIPNPGPGEAAFQDTGEFVCASNRVDFYYQVEKPREPQGVHPELTLSYSGPGGFFKLGDQILVVLTATNTGDVAVTPVAFGYEPFPHTSQDDGSDFQYYEGKEYQPGEFFNLYYAVRVTPDDAADGTILRHCWIDYTFLDATGAKFPGQSNTVHPQFLLEGQEILPQLQLDYVAGSGDGKALGDYIDIALTVKNTGNVPVKITNMSRGGQSGAMAGGDDYTDYYAQLENKVLSPGEEASMLYYAHVLEQELQEMVVQRNILVMGTYEAPQGDPVGIESNWVYPSIPLTNTPGLVPPVFIEGWGELHLDVVQTSPAVKDPYQLSDLDVCFWHKATVTNIGSAPVYVERVRYYINGTTEQWWDYDVVLAPGESCSRTFGPVLHATNIAPGTASETLQGTITLTFQAIGHELDTLYNCLSNQVELVSKFAAPEPGIWNPPEEHKGPDMKVTKTVMYPSLDPNGFQLYETIYYRIELVETSEEYSLPWIIVGDTLAHYDHGDAVIDNINGMGPGTFEISNYQHTVTPEDVENGYVTNQAYAEWVDETTGKTITVWSEPVTVPVIKEPVHSPTLSLIKSVVSAPANGEYYTEGEMVQYKIEIRNESQSTLYNLKVYDDLYYDEVFDHQLYTAASFIPGENDSAYFSYQVTGGDVAVGSITNIATGVGYDDHGMPVPATSNPVTVPTGRPKDQLTIIKQEVSTPNNDHYYTEGETIAYKITLVNTGDSQLEVIVYDTLKEEDFGEIGSVEILHPGQSWKFFYSHEVTAQDVQDHYVVNYAIGHYTGSFGSGAVTSDPVISPTSDDTIITTGGKITPQPGDSCFQALTSVGESSLDFTQHYCESHMAAYQQMQALLSKAYSDAARLSAWQQAANIWRGELDALYEALLKAANGEAKATVLNDRMMFLINLGAYENQLRQIHPSAPALVAQRVSEQLMEQCAELCYLIHNAPNDRADSLITGNYVRTIGGVCEACGREVLSENGQDVYLRQSICAEHKSVKDAVEYQVQYGASDLSRDWQRARALWQASLDSMTNSHYKAASAQDRQVIAMCRVSFDQLLAARQELLKLFYPTKPSVVSEVLSNTVMNRTLDLCEEW